MARLEGIKPEQAGWLKRQAYRAGEKRIGQVLEPMTLKAHSSSIFLADGLFEILLQRAKSLDPGLKSLASLKAAGLVGCVW